MTLTLLSNILVAALLVATIGYAIVLNHRLGVLRSDRAKLQDLIQALTAATTNAQAGIAGLRQTAEELSGEVEKRLAATRTLKDDLTYLIERGTATADRLEGTIRARRDEPARPSEGERATVAIRSAASERIAARSAVAEKVMTLRTEADEVSALRRPGGTPVSRSERELLRALGGSRR